MTRIWVYSVGNMWDAARRSEKAFAAELANWLQGDLRQDGVADCVAEVWVPFSSERQYRGERQVIMLLVGDWKRFTRTDYFVAANALALCKTGVAHLVPVIYGGIDAEPQADGWTERYWLLWKRLSSMPASECVEVTAADYNALRELLLGYVKAAISGGPSIEKSTAGPVSVFISYCHRDEKLRDELCRHLKLLERTGLIQGWHDRNIVAGHDWSAEIDSHLYTSDLILLLLSSDFFASDYCAEIETPIALERHKANSARAIPVLLRPVVWRLSALSALQALPRDGKPVIEWTSTDSAFVSVCEGLVETALSWARSSATEPGEFRLLPDEHRVSSRKRVLDAAMPAMVEIEKAVMLVVLIRKAVSSGLRGILAVDPTFGFYEKDVKSYAVILGFNVDERSGKPEPLSARISVNSPDFDPPRQYRNISIDPNNDSPPCIFLLAAKRAGCLVALVEVYKEEQLLVSCPIGTIAVADEVRMTTSKNVTSVVIDSDISYGPGDFTGMFRIPSEAPPPEPGPPPAPSNQSESGEFTRMFDPTLRNPRVGPHSPEPQSRGASPSEFTRILQPSVPPRTEAQPPPLAPPVVTLPLPPAPAPSRKSPARQRVPLLLLALLLLVIIAGAVLVVLWFKSR